MTIQMSGASVAGGKAALIGGSTFGASLAAKWLAEHYGLDLDTALYVVALCAGVSAGVHRYVATKRAEQSTRFWAWYKTSNGWLGRQLRAFFGVTQVNHEY